MKALNFVFKLFQGSLIIGYSIFFLFQSFWGYKGTVQMLIKAIIN